MELTKADLLVFGSSRANHHYVPEVFEDSLKLTFYNTGKDGSGIFITLHYCDLFCNVINQKLSFLIGQGNLTRTRIPMTGYQHFFPITGHTLK